MQIWKCDCLLYSKISLRKELPALCISSIFVRSVHSESVLLKGSIVVIVHEANQLCSHPQFSVGQPGKGEIITASWFLMWPRTINCSCDYSQHKYVSHIPIKVPLFWNMAGHFLQLWPGHFLPFAWLTFTSWMFMFPLLGHLINDNIFNRGKRGQCNKYFLASKTP